MRQLRLVAVALAAVALPAVLAASPAAADEHQPWCAVYPSDMGRTLNCAFGTREQCLAGVAGIGTCEPNRSSNSRRKAPGRDHRRRQH
jgi:Protein of unknown function (DUF3551)